MSIPSISGNGGKIYLNQQFSQVKPTEYTPDTKTDNILISEEAKKGEQTGIQTGQLGSMGAKTVKDNKGKEENASLQENKNEKTGETSQKNETAEDKTLISEDKKSQEASTNNPVILQENQAHNDKTQEAKSKKKLSPAEIEQQRKEDEEDMKAAREIYRQMAQAQVNWQKEATLTLKEALDDVLTKILTANAQRSGVILDRVRYFLGMIGEYKVY